MTKRQDVIAKLQDGWVSVPDMLASTGWKSHTLRGVLSTLSSRERLKLERKRAEGITSYRILPEAAE